MKLQPTEQSIKDYQRLPQTVQPRVDKTLRLLLDNPRHPSLRIKKMKGFLNHWEARVTIHYRLLFTVEHDTYLLLRVGTHDLLKER